VALLEIRNLVKYFGGLAAISGIDIDVNQGEILGLIGPNGAGKTTMFNLITGTFRPTSGSIVFKGENIVGLRPYQIAARGLVRTFQSTTLFSEATVRQNVVTAFHMEANVSFWGAVFGGKAVNMRENNVLKKADELLEFLGLSHLQNELASALPHGHQRRLGVAIALATSPKLILLDEPVTGMNSEETREMMATIGKVRDSEITVLLVEHDMKAVMGMCDRIVVLDYGQKIAEGVPSEIKENLTVIRAYLGERRRAA
jgi:branched-chain amino acid transport system ATP-binding protein